MPLNSHLAIIARHREEQRPRRQHPPPLPRPIPEGVRDVGRRYSIAQRVQCLTLLALKIERKKIRELTTIPLQTQSNILKKAQSRGYNPDVDFRILDYYVEDGSRSGRPREVEEETKQLIVDSVQRDRAGREKTAAILAYEHGVSESTVLNILREQKISSVKPSRKPGLTQLMRAFRLQFCLDHQYWTLEDWKKVIWTDETSVILGVRRGAVRIWRRADEAYVKSAVRNRWKGFSEFMFWAAFTYDHKGPCHIWSKETAAAKKASEAHIAQLNADLEPAAKAEWEISTAMRRMNLRRRVGGRAPIWRFNKEHGKWFLICAFQ